ncbi:MAG: hypothetical protein M3N82_12035, partial [Pseudomonadota bacterium]|nr:hypothetical protein [Pseudomonadota bacterium]
MNTEASQSAQDIAGADAVDPGMPLSEFLETVPPGSERNVDLRMAPGKNMPAHLPFVELPPIRLHCENEHCGGVRTFEPISSWQTGFNTAADEFLYYLCRNCKASQKVFALRAQIAAFRAAPTPTAVRKLGEIPAFGPPTPSRLTRLLEAERDYYLKGRRAESQAMGIAAFAYYRRVVENKKDAIFDEIIRVAELLKADSAMIADVRAARGQVQFTQAVESIKHGIPQALMVAGHNPLTLLHAALSEGLHAQTDAECLE